MSLASSADREEFGRQARNRAPLADHGEVVWADRADPVELIAGQNETRVLFLVPVRHHRMRESAFTFYRGTAAVMAADLARTPRSGLDVQLVGDAHLSNFGAYASPERRLIFDANDFDETRRGSWEWDLKRLATSFMIAAEHKGFDRRTCREVTARVPSVYRMAMAHFGTMGFLELWYEHLSTDDLRASGRMVDAEFEERLDKFERKARKRTSLQALKKLTSVEQGRPRFRSDPPLLVPLREARPDLTLDEIDERVGLAFEDYKRTLRDERRMLLDQLRFHADLCAPHPGPWSRPYR